MFHVTSAEDNVHSITYENCIYCLELESSGDETVCRNLEQSCVNVLHKNSVYKSVKRIFEEGKTNIHPKAKMEYWTISVLYSRSLPFTSEEKCDFLFSYNTGIT